MKIKNLHTTKGFATLEYVILMLILLVAFIVSKDYIVRAYQGRWRAAGASVSHERQFNPYATASCKCETVITDEETKTTKTICYDEMCFDGLNATPWNWEAKDSCAIPLCQK